MEKLFVGLYINEFFLDGEVRVISPLEISQDLVFFGYVRLELSTNISFNAKM